MKLTGKKINDSINIAKSYFDIEFYQVELKFNCLLITGYSNSKYTHIDIEPYCEYLKNKKLKLKGYDMKTVVIKNSKQEFIRFIQEKYNEFLEKGE